MASRSLPIKSVEATNEIDLGSDHRVVKTCYNLHGTRYFEKSHTQKMKGWRPYLDERGEPKNYQTALNGGLVGEDTSNPDVLEKILYQAATARNVSTVSHDRTKPWKEPEIQALLFQRKLCTSPYEKRAISKKIQKVSRRLTRKYDEKTEEILKEFADLGRLDNVLQHAQPKNETHYI